MNTKFLLGLSALLVLSTASIAVAQRALERSEHGTSLRQDRRDGEGRRQRRRIHRRHRRGHRIGEALGVSEAQKAQGREASKQLAPIVRDMKPQVRELMQQARALKQAGDREGARELLRRELRPLLEDAHGRARPIVQPLIESLTAEQRAKLAQAAARRGVEFDEARFARRLALRLAARAR